MTNKNTNLNYNYPLLLKPCGKDYLWGGQRINNEYAKGLEMPILAESWECSTHPDGLSYLSDENVDLKTFINLHFECLGLKHLDKKELPILIKFIDANKDLSIQVHPDDEYARSHENGQLGKNEFWYVLDAKKDSEIVYGLNTNAKRDKLKKALEDKTIEKYLQKVKIKKDDVFFIKAGTVHAIGSGALIAEIQENSNLTYRLYDYDRLDKNGSKRELHINKALDVINYQSSKEPSQPIRVLKYQPGMALEQLCRCSYFEVYRMLLNTERKQIVTYKNDELSFRILLCLNGCGSFKWSNNVKEFYKGDCFFIPANCEEFIINGSGEFLDIRG